MTTYISLAGVVASLAGLAAIAGFNSWTSRINQFFFFSRTVDAGFAATDPARRITSQYLRLVRMGFAVSLIVFSAMMVLTPASIHVCFITAMVVECLCCCAAFRKAHRAAGAAIRERGVVDEESRAAQSTSVAVPLLDPGSFTRPMMAMLTLAPVVGAAAWLIPMMAMHMGFGAFSDAIAANGAEFLTGLGLGLMGGSLLLYAQLRYFSRHRSPMARFTARGCVQLAWLGSAALAVSTVSVPLHLVITQQIKFALVGIVLAIAAGRIAYGWVKARQFPPPAIERTGDQFWRWGLFYYNPSDPTLFIQHRSGPGYTVNFANRLSWPLALLVVTDLVFLASIHLHR
jgi:hypothetical protein